MINALLWAPLAFGIVGLFLPKRATGWWATLGAVVTLGIAISIAVGFDSGSSGLQHAVDVSWISGLGVDYSLGIDGLNLFLILLTAVLWIGGIAFAAFREQERPQLFFFLMLVAETATLGSFLAQDLLLFVLFFDFMLVPFYFLFGSWGSDREGGPTAAAATLKMMIFTLIGSLLMLVAAVAAAIISADGGHLTFSIAAIQQQGLGVGSQRWLFWFFTAAFLVKMPAFLLHGWMPDAYRAAPLPVLVVFSGVLAKVGAYGFLRVVLPLFPDATIEFQEVVLVIALASILYGSVMAFTQTNMRLIAGYSSVAQLGFITAGIFALRADGADGAILQMVNHGLVVAPLFVIVAILVERTGTEDIREVGGMALRAPVLAALFLIVALATLAMPGSANFIGEFYILNGLFQAKIVFAFVAISGVAMSAYYALRLYQHAMHNRPPSQQNNGIASREIGWRDGIVLAPLVLCILALALYPQLILHRTAPTVQQTVASVTGGSAPEAQLASNNGPTGLKRPNNGRLRPIDREEP
jgi:NADH-quinone oxidoreductase subunit M